MKKLDYLTYAVTLYFDDKTSEQIRDLTKNLSDVTGNDYMIQNDVPPHLTLGMFHVGQADVDKLKRLFVEFVERAQAEVLCGKNFEISFGAFEDFVGKVIFVKIEKDKKLMEANRLLHDLFCPHFEAGDNRNYLPENWYPHITLGFKLTGEQFEKGLEFLKGTSAQGIGGAPQALRSNGGISRNPAKPGLPNGRCARIGLACCNPYTPVYEISI